VLANETRWGNIAAIELGLATLQQKAIVERRSKVDTEKRVYDSHAAVALHRKTHEYAIRGYILNLKLADFDFDVVVAAV